MRFDERGRLLAMIRSGGTGTLLYEYDTLGRLRNVLYGHGNTEYEYFNYGLLKVAKLRHTKHDVKLNYKYKAGLTKEMHIQFGRDSNLHNAELKFAYDGSARLRRLDCEINQKEISGINIRYDNTTGILQALDNLRFIRNTVLETQIQDQKKIFILTRTLDDYGRLSTIRISLHGATVYTLHLKYNSRGKISEHIMEIEKRRVFTNLTYMTDGQLHQAAGVNKFSYTYNRNGNLMSHTNGSRAEFLHYEFDRVTKAGDGDIDYDERGFVVRFDTENFDYDAKGHLIKGWSKDKKWWFSLGYDHLDRVSVYRDHLGNVTQMFYGRPDIPNMITHLHRPRESATSTLLYDDENNLIAVDAPEGRYYVATDQNGSPVAYFDDVQGRLVYSTHWSPFGSKIESDGREIWIGVGPWGGIIEPISGIVLVDGHPYHPRLHQWLTPRWDLLTQPTREVTDVFVYRFRNNDPINPPETFDYHFNGKYSIFIVLFIL